MSPRPNARMRDTGRMRPSHPSHCAVALLIAIAVVLGACASAEAPATPAAPTVAVDPDHVIELELTGDLKIKQDGQQVSTIPVTQGGTYTFRLTNSAGYAHDFKIGADTDLGRGAGGLPGIESWNGGTREFQYTFSSSAGSSAPIAYGCTLPGHYALMKGSFDLRP